MAISIFDAATIFEPRTYDSDIDAYLSLPLESFPLTQLFLKEFPEMIESEYVQSFANMDECLGAIDQINLAISRLPSDDPTLPRWKEYVKVCEDQYDYGEQLIMMAGYPRLTTNNLPTLSEDAASATSSPARGKEMRQNLLGKLQPPPFVHVWEFYHDRQDRKKAPSPDGSNDQAQQAQPSYEDRLVKLCDISNVKDFWETFNNFDITRLALRDSIHLFHKDVKPVWEDKRNVNGGAWTFRVPKAQAPEFWKAVSLMAVGEQLQEAVESKRQIFIDDICGVSLSVRFNSSLIQVWNRDGNHQAAIDKILATVLEDLPEELTPKEGSYYYKRHDEHAGFKKPDEQESKP